ncbi:MAG: hypothetical protein CM15mV87_010 [Caudoviricetes sp.]|nr:MAG: hypothetical protein CM15mV87_010 [Caudoviricetes sp.]
MDNTKVNLDQFERAGVYLFLGRFYLPALTKFRPETEKDRFERMENIICQSTTKSLEQYLKMV